MKILLLCILLLSGLFCESFVMTQDDIAQIKKSYGERGETRAKALLDFMNKNKDKNIVEKLVAVNKFYNDISYGTDQNVWGVDDYWATISEFVGKGVGDCEDYAIAKYFTLTALGVPSDKLYLTYVKALKLNQAHMVLTYFKDKKSVPVVLDNIDPAIKPATQRTDLAPVFSFNAESLYMAKQQGLGTAVPDGNEKNKKWLELLKKVKKQ